MIDSEDAPLERAGTGGTSLSSGLDDSQKEERDLRLDLVLNVLDFRRCAFEIWLSLRSYADMVVVGDRGGRSLVHGDRGGRSLVHGVNGGVGNASTGALLSLLNFKYSLSRSGP